LALSLRAALAASGARTVASVRSRSAPAASAPSRAEAQARIHWWSMSSSGHDQALLLNGRMNAAQIPSP
jgi:hypothetical protein